MIISHTHLLLWKSEFATLTVHIQANELDLFSNSNRNKDFN